MINDVKQYVLSSKNKVNIYEDIAFQRVGYSCPITKKSWSIKIDNFKIYMAAEQDKQVLINMLRLVQNYEVKLILLAEINSVQA